MSHTKTFDCEGCRPYCYGGYHMREDADGDGDYVLAEDFNRVKKQRDELLAALNDAVQIAKVAHEYWDRDQDSKVGKYLMALAGNLPGYSALTDGVHKAIASAKGGAA